MKVNSKLLSISACSLAAGITNGLLGAGGGIVLIFALSPILRGIHDKDGDEFYKRKDVMAISLSVMLPISVVSAIRYASNGALDTAYAAKLLLPTIIGGVVGGILLNKLRDTFIMKIFAFLVIYSGLVMIVR